MADILQTTFSNAFSWMKVFGFWFKFDLTSSQSLIEEAIIGLANGLVPNRCQAITWINDDQDFWHRTASLGHNELMTCGHLIYSTERHHMHVWNLQNYIRQHHTLYERSNVLVTTIQTNCCPLGKKEGDLKSHALNSQYCFQPPIPGIDLSVPTTNVIW